MSEDKEDGPLTSFLRESLLRILNTETIRDKIFVGAEEEKHLICKGLVLGAAVAVLAPTYENAARFTEVLENGVMPQAHSNLTESEKTYVFAPTKGLTHQHAEDVRVSGFPLLADAIEIALSTGPQPESRPSGRVKRFFNPNHKP
jgi:hypothetical protein